MSVCFYSLCVLFCVEGVALRRVDPPSKESYRLYINSVAVGRKRTIPTERPPLVGEVSAKLCG
jgi:hypothetical protein